MPSIEPPLAVGAPKSSVVLGGPFSFPDWATAREVITGKLQRMNDTTHHMDPSGTININGRWRNARRMLRRRLAMPKKPLQPKDFPVHEEGKTIVTDDNKRIAEADDPKMAEEISDRLNTDEARREDDRWA